MNELDATILWVSDYYDGPLSGMCLVNEQLCWFQVDPETVNEYDPETDEWLPRRYFIYELSDCEARKLATEHFRFELYVGNNRLCNHKSDGIKPQDEWCKFYDSHEPSCPAEGKTPIGILK
jgi:hypothetical protein